MTTSTLKAGVAAVLRGVPGLGVLDTQPLHQGQDGQRIRTASANPYWTLRLTRAGEEPAGLGGGSFFVRYALRLEGWRGIVGTGRGTGSEIAPETEAWEALVESIRGALHSNAGQRILAQTCDRAVGQGQGGFQRVLDLAAEAVEIVTVTGDRGGEFRAHHALITGTLECYVVRSS